MKGNKGITLIALVVTIIVLLILAAVAIAMLTGDNSILKRAQSTQAYTAIGAAKDEVNLAYNAAFADYLKAKYEADNTVNPAEIKFSTFLNKRIGEARTNTTNRDTSAGKTTITPDTISDSTTEIKITFKDAQSQKTYETKAKLSTTVNAESLSAWSKVSDPDAE